MCSTITGGMLALMRHLSFSFSLLASLSRLFISLGEWRRTDVTQDQFEEVYSKVTRGKDFSEKVVEFVRKRQLIEKEYAKKLQALTKSSEIEMGCVAHNKTLLTWHQANESHSAE